MTQYIINRLEKNAKDAQLRKQYGLASGIIGIFLNFLLFVIKLVVGLFLGSVAIMADAVNNLMDSASSIITIVGFKISAKPADKEHPFGHGRLEDVVGLIIAILIIFVGLEFARSSFDRILNPEDINFSWLSIALLSFSFFVKLWMYGFNKKIGRRIKSNPLLAVATDSRNDCIISIFTVSSLIVAYYFDIHVDGVAGILVSLFFIYSGYKAAHGAVSSILGKPANKELADSIKEIVLGYDGIIGVHDLAIHEYGMAKLVATIHVEMDMEKTLGNAHDIADKAAKDVLDKLSVDLTMHLDPIDVNCPHLGLLKDLTRAYIAANCNDSDAHEFRISGTAPKLQLIFDLQLPYGKPQSDIDALLSGLDNEISKHMQDVEIVANVEYGYIETE
ncbi:MAG: cation diffusion facilitator family transporter [Defluviitaleaceae bacterium]|nr:cation diffusion facilitator family transporter [Defluviitaleaceae bacterium]